MAWLEVLRGWNFEVLDGFYCFRCDLQCIAIWQSSEKECSAARIYSIFYEHELTDEAHFFSTHNFQTSQPLPHLHATNQQFQTFDDVVVGSAALRAYEAVILYA